MPEDKVVRVIDFFSGIGGCTAAVMARAQVVQAFDQNPYAASVYEANFDHPVSRLNLAGIRAEQIEQADLWWMSPPCQPFTVRGHQRGLDDPRCKPFVRMLDMIRAHRPEAVALENVPAFQHSDAHRALLLMLKEEGYQTQERLDCPTRLGVPNRRERFFLVAARGPLGSWSDEQEPMRPLSAFLDAPDQVEQGLLVDEDTRRAYRHALPIVDAEQPDAVAFCFTSAYGRSPVHAGSYLQTPTGVRRFSPNEILRLHAFPSDFALPPDMPHTKAWPLVGNALSVPCVQACLEPILGR
jgi:DNA (cytosine-5)-methyltransferase 1/tRNA (cytosine38-C5)-methyltransferase